MKRFLLNTIKSTTGSLGDVSWLSEKIQRKKNRITHQHRSARSWDKRKVLAIESERNKMKWNEPKNETNAKSHKTQNFIPNPVVFVWVVFSDAFCSMLAQSVEFFRGTSWSCAIARWTSARACYFIASLLFVSSFRLLLHWLSLFFSLHHVESVMRQCNVSLLFKFFFVWLWKYAHFSLRCSYNHCRFFAGFDNKDGIGAHDTMRKVYARRFCWWKNHYQTNI